jgi:hypothetical protein
MNGNRPDMAARSPGLGFGARGPDRGIGERAAEVIFIIDPSDTQAFRHESIGAVRQVCEE